MKQPQDDLRRRVRAFLERTGMTRDAFAVALGKKSGSAWTSQWLTGGIKGTAKTADAIEALMASKEPAPARISALPETPPSPVEWTTARISDELRTTAKLLGLSGDESLLNIAATRLDVLNSTIGTIRQLTRDRDD